MPAINRPVAWLRDALRRWRERESLIVIEELTEYRARAEFDHPRNTALWFLPPPC